MEKKGQIYILAALMLGIIIYGLSTIVNFTDQEEIKGDFGLLANNYEIESAKLINSLLQSGGNISDNFSSFTFLFTSYSKAKSPNFNLFYALAFEGQLHVGNFMDDDVTVYVPCPQIDSCTVITEIPLIGCLANISSKLGFDDLTIEPEYLIGGENINLNSLKDKCLSSTEIGNNKEYCLEIGGVMYNLSIETNSPKIFSLSRLKSGNQILNSVQGEIGEEKICEERNEANCCPEFCHWDDDNGCLEGKLELPEAKCGDGNCDVGEGCASCPDDCVCCTDGTRDGRCSITQPKYCEDGNLIEDCDSCGCPNLLKQTCLESGRCCVRESESCDGSLPCCNDRYYYCDGECKQFNELCDDGEDNDGDGDIDCEDSECEGYCSTVDKPKRCEGGNWVNNCDECSCPEDKPNCQPNGKCKLEKTQKKCFNPFTKEICTSSTCYNVCNSLGYDIGQYKGSCDCGVCGGSCKNLCRCSYEPYFTACSRNPSCESGEQEISKTSC